MERLQAAGGAACQSLIDKALSVAPAAAPKHRATHGQPHDTVPMSPRGHFCEGWAAKKTQWLKGDLLKLPLGKTVLSTQYKGLIGCKGEAHCWY